MLGILFNNQWCSAAATDVAPVRPSPLFLPCLAQGPLAEMTGGFKSTWPQSIGPSMSVPDAVQIGDDLSSFLPAPKKQRPERFIPDSESRISFFVGVCWNKRVGKWAAQSRLNGKTLYLGYFFDEKDAARKYDEHAASVGRPVNFPRNSLQLQARKCAPRVRRGTSRKCAGNVAQGNAPVDPGATANSNDRDLTKTAAAEEDGGKEDDAPDEEDEEDGGGRGGEAALRAIVWQLHLRRSPQSCRPRTGAV